MFQSDVGNSRCWENKRTCMVGLERESYEENHVGPFRDFVELCYISNGKPFVSVKEESNII